MPFPKFKQYLQYHYKLHFLQTSPIEIVCMTPIFQIKQTTYITTSSIVLFIFSFDYFVSH